MSKKITVRVGVLHEGARTLEVLSGAEGSSVSHFGILQEELPAEGFNEEGAESELEMSDEQYDEIFFHTTKDQHPSSKPADEATETATDETATAAAEDAGDDDTAGQE